MRRSETAVERTSNQEILCLLNLLKKEEKRMLESGPPIVMGGVRSSEDAQKSMLLSAHAAST